MSSLFKSPKMYLTDGGLETTFVFEKNINLPHFAAFVLLSNLEGQQYLKDYYQTYLEVAKKHRINFILETPTWRAHTDWGNLMGFDAKQLDQLNRLSITMLQSLRDSYCSEIDDIIVSGCIGPRGDGYKPKDLMNPIEAMNYHQTQINSFTEAGADMISAMTLCYPDEAIGITQAAQHNGLPVCIAFTLETDGCLIGGMSLEQAITQVDQATDQGPAYYMVNCAHPDHFSAQINDSTAWQNRVRGIRANASRLSHEALDNSTELDSGNPYELGLLYKNLNQRLARLKVIGGCCGTNHQHIEAICGNF